MWQLKHTSVTQHPALFFNCRSHRPADTPFCHCSLYTPQNTPLHTMLLAKQTHGAALVRSRQQMAVPQRSVRVGAQKKQLMMWEALREAVDEEMEKDPTVCVMGECCCC